MTKKDYVRLANALIEQARDGSSNIYDTPGYIASKLEEDNPRFNRERWFKYLKDNGAHI